MRSNKEWDEAVEGAEEKADSIATMKSTINACCSYLEQVRTPS